MYSSPNIIQVIKTVSMRKAGNVARVYRGLVGSIQERGHFEDLGVDG